MQKNHLIYFENSLSRPKSKSYSRLRLDRTAAGRASSRVKGQGQPSRSPDRDRGEPPSVDRLKEPPLSGEKEPSLAKTVETVVSSWLRTAVQRVALHSARAAPGPETATGTEATRRFSEPILPPPSPIPSTADNSRANKLQEMLDAIKDNFLAWKVPHLEHFEEEEKVMMPLVPQIAPSPLSRCRVVHREMISPAVDRSMGDFLFFIGWCTAKLNAHGSQQHPPAVAVRVFVRALQSTSSAAQWSVFGPVLQNNCSEEIWESMVAKYSVDRPFGDELLLGSADADFSGEPPTAFSIVINAHEAMRAAVSELERQLDDLSSNYDTFSTLVREYHRAVSVHSHMEDTNMLSLLDSMNTLPLGLHDLHVADDMLWGHVEASMGAYEEARDAAGSRPQAMALWENMLANMTRCMDALNYNVIVEGEKESKRLVWFQNTLGYLCILQGLRDTGADTVNRGLFKELRALLNFLQTVDFRTIPMRRLKKATEYYRQHIQLQPVVRELVREHKASTNAETWRKSSKLSTNTTKSKHMAPRAVVSMLRWIIFFQMLLEMRLLAYHRKQQKKLQHSASVKSDFGASPHPPVMPNKRHQQGLMEEGSLTSHASKYLLTCDDIFKISRKSHEGESGDNC